MRSSSAAPLDGDLGLEVHCRSTRVRALVPRSMLERPTSVGSAGAVRVKGPSVLPEHALLMMRGGVVHVASADPSNPVLVDGAPAPTYWVAVPLPCRLTIGGVTVDVFSTDDPYGARARASASLAQGKARDSLTPAAGVWAVDHRSTGSFPGASLAMDLREDSSSLFERAAADVASAWRRAPLLARAFTVAGPLLVLACVAVGSSGDRSASAEGDDDAAPAVAAPAPARSASVEDDVRSVKGLGFATRAPLKPGARHR